MSSATGQPDRPATALVESAVLVPVYRDGAGGLRIVLIRRVDSGPHAGQIALPGGKREADDASPEATAVRETTEEIGVSAHGIHVLEALPPVRTLTTGFEIHPFLAGIEPPARWTPEPGEVAAVLELDVADLCRPHARRREWIAAPGIERGAEFPCLRIDDIRIWGATYRILEPLLPRIDAIVADAGR